MIYDIIYRVYFYVDDYNTLQHFMILNKTFNKNYMQNYDVTYRHRINILFKCLCEFLEESDKERISNKICGALKNDLKFLYFSIREFMVNQLEYYYSITFIQNVSFSLINIMMMQGEEFLKCMFLIKVNKNKIKFKPLLQYKGHYLAHLMGSFNRKCSYSFIKTQIKLWERIFIN